MKGRYALLLGAALLGQVEAQGTFFSPFKPMPVLPNPKVIDTLVKLTSPLSNAELLQYFQALQNGSALKAPQGNATSPVGSASGPEKVAGSTGSLVCTSQKYSMKSAPAEYAMSSKDADKVWVGSLLQSKSLSNGQGGLLRAYVPESQRQPLRLTSAAPTAVASQSIAPSQSAYNVYAAKVRQALNGVAMGSQVAYEVSQESAFESSALEVGINARYLTASAAANVKSKFTTEKNRITATFVQRAFTVNADLSQQPALSLFKGTGGKNLSGSDLAGLAKSAPWAAGNPPVLVNSVTYGRLLFVSMESSYSAQEMEVALRASYQAGVYETSGNVKVDVKKVLSDSKFKVYADGGNENQIIGLIRDQKLGSYFNGQVTAATALNPISFTTINLGDGSQAADFRSTELTDTRCNAASMRLFMKVQLRVDNPNDNSYDDIYGNINVNGTPIWRRGTEDPYEIYPGPKVYLYPEDHRYIYKTGTEPFYLDVDFSGNQTAKFEMSLIDYDKGSGDDFLGSATQVMNVADIARAFQKDPNRTSYEYPPFMVRNPGAGFDSWVFVTFYKNW